jgi:putative metalloprotease
MKYLTLKFLLAGFCLAQSLLSFPQIQIGKVKLNDKTMSSASKAGKALTLSEADVVNITKEYVRWSDENNPVASDDSPYTIRLNKIVKKHTREDGLDLNFKVYDVQDVNAFAAADGSVRVFAGLMDLMTDEEILSVIGHEIGHVKNHDTKDAIKNAYMASAAHDAASSQGGKVGALSDIELGDFAEAIAKSKFSQSQETEADNHGFEFLKRNNYKLTAIGSAFRKLQKLEDESGGDKSKLKQLFSSHPDIAKRAERMEKKAKE